MSYRRDRKRLRRAQRQLQRQRRRLLDLDTEGLLTLTLHSLTRSLTLTLDPNTCSEVVDVLLAQLRERRRELAAQLAQVQEDQQATPPLGGIAGLLGPASAPLS